jgi:glycosyltransferase involved in cell wall biosynthesis
MPPRDVSLCLIVRDEATNLPGCLGPVADLVKEMIVVDTGSTDDTRQVAARLGARVVDFPWTDSFAAARNESLRHATCPWIFWLDADDRLPGENRARLAALLANLGEEEVAYQMGVRLRWSAGDAVTVDQVRLFRNLPPVHWQYRVHEQLMAGTDWLAKWARQTDVVIEHRGYDDAGLVRRKHERNLRLLEMNRRESPDDPVVLFHLGWTFLKLGRPAEAVPHFHRGLHVVPPTLSLVPGLFLLLGQAYEQLGKLPEALAVYQQGRRRFPNEPALAAQEELLSRSTGTFLVRGW